MLKDVFVNVEVLKVMMTICATLILSGISILALKYGFAKPFADVVTWYKQNYTQIRAAIDDPSDMVNQRLEELTHIAAEDWAIILPVVVAAVKSGAEAVPLGERVKPAVLPVTLSVAVESAPEVVQPEIALPPVTPETFDLKE